MRIRSWANNANSFGDNGFRTDWATAVWKGILLPLPILAWAGRDLWAGNVHWGRGLNAVTDNSYIVGGFVAVKVGIAAVLFTWHFLANSPRFDRWIHGLMLVAVIAAGLGLFSIVYGALL